MQRSSKIIAALALAFSAHAGIANAAPGVEQHTQSFLDALAKGGGQPLETLSPAVARQVLAGAQAGAALPAADVSEKTISVDGKAVRLHIVRPHGVQGVLPVFMFVHGGGWILGDFPTHERLVRDLVAESGAVAVFVDYTPSPEARYPVAINEIYGATQWVAAHGAEINVDGKRLAVVGNSVGGNMAAVTALMAKDLGGPQIRAQVLFWPVTNASFENASYDEFEQGYFLTRPMMKWFWDAYTSDAAQRKEIYAAPLLATPAQLKGLPPALVITAEKDVLRDEGEAYARKLDAAGVPVVATRYNGMIHDFGLLNVLANVPATRSALHQAAEELKARLK
ncbi:alpha/beta hydrolase [Duganella qianjiadongensis]|uniref:Alpha/beta hydrolase fold domain-containing protein n=1 Tax=Duganella qianjiadongensis TaxID=2692176 RepID=A0ABW9VMK1_9BURK|nr:alpha/beta hydrolase [Duganella qianjiadongensis]MYM40661.1 alpha/beta hydrolase fold domain-containing protein [Duganella qianjiadongensis]